MDDAIVVAENITRHREMGKEQVNAAIDGVREMFWPVTTTIITTILAFLPMFFLSGILGRFIYTIPVVVVAALIFSLFECTCLLPAHVAMGKSTGKDEEAAWWTRIKNLYERLLKGFLKRRFLTILLFIGFLGFSGVLFKTKMTYVLFPYNDVDSLFVLAEMPEGTPLQTTSKKMEAVEAFVSKVAGKDSSGYITTIGHHDTDPYGATGGQKENHALITLILKPAIQRGKTSETIMREIEKGLLDLTKKQGFTKLWTKKYKDGPPVGRPVTLSVVTKNTELRNKVSKDIFDFLSSVKGVVDLESDMKEGQNELRIIPNYYKMGRLGVTVETVAHTLRVAFQGSVPTKIVQEGEEIDFRLQISKKGFEDEREILKKVQVMNQRGRLLDLLPLVKLQEVRGQTIIRHYNGKPSVTISSDLNEKVTTSKKV
ncbi:MAG: efflux RND transporter permease subunit, partial [Bdellovibrionota bacterium]|nr:efflux RND transporter permease subunit [Bdellovibrionota bacterium]